MKKYDAYKPSGVDWIGEVPKGWKVKRLKHVAKFINGFAFDSQDFKQESDIPVIRIGDIVDGGINSSNALFVKKDSSLNQFEIKKDDILLAMSGATVGKIGIVDNEEGYINQRVGIIRYNNAKFMYYLLSDQKFMTYVLLTSLGSAQPNISTESINNYPCIFPPLSEQTAIANYLDDKCAKIDNVVAIQQKRIELLKELKQSIITKAVTKGLDKNAKMKESGIEWVGEVPEGWEIDKLRYIGRYRKGPFGSALKVSMFVPKGNNTIKVYEQQNAIDKDWELGEYYITKEYFYSDLSAFEVLPRDIIVSCAGTIGECYLMPDNIEKGIINQALMRMRMNETRVYIPFFLFLFDILLKEESKISSNGSAMKNIPPFDVLKAMKISLPPLSEQTAIATYLNKKCAAIDRQIAKIDKQIELLKEYKQSVITECVTGKRKVC